jgi:hypothetical protein
MPESGKADIGFLRDFICVAGKSIGHHSDQPIHHFSVASTAFRARRSVSVAGALEWLLVTVEGRQMTSPSLSGQKSGPNPKRSRRVIESARRTRPFLIYKNEKTSSRALLEVFGGLHKVGHVSLRREPDGLKPVRPLITLKNYLSK